ncbi:hypothetical protein HWV62_26144 [Athelia sp. TMB]|nr:hypothetical protein HWV62_26144 [Athelia sp. TMB]
MAKLLAILFTFSSINTASSLAVNITSALHAPAATGLPTTANLATVSITQSCDDIHTCRTLYSIVQTCLATILACVWAAVHRNIPAPKAVPGPRKRGRFMKAARWLWANICNQRELAIVLIVTLLAPEWVLAWAIRQRLRAGKLVMELEKARAEAAERWKEDHVKEAEDRGTRVAGRGSSENLIENRPSATSKPSHPAHSESRDAWRGAWSVAKLSQDAHAFFIIMGGYQAYDKDGPIHPLGPNEVVELVRVGALVPPTEDELSNQSKGDVLSKGVAILQTIWFVAQCIARLVEHLPLTNLEVMTLAYTIMTVAMYIAWWNKPLNVSCAIRVPGARIRGQDYHQNSWWDISYYVIGWQDNEVDLDYVQGVPTFWAGKVEDDDLIHADIIALLVATTFGAVHCIAWSYTFASRTELLMWRASAIAIVTIPAGLIIGLGMPRVDKSSDVWYYITIIASLIGAPVYICARAILLVLSCDTLKSLPYNVYQTVQGTDFIPHI